MQDINFCLIKNLKHHSISHLQQLLNTYIIKCLCLRSECCFIASGNGLHFPENWMVWFCCLEERRIFHIWPGSNDRNYAWSTSMFNTHTQNFVQKLWPKISTLHRTQKYINAPTSLYLYKFNWTMLNIKCFWEGAQWVKGWLDRASRISSMYPDVKQNELRETLKPEDQLYIIEFIWMLGMTATSRSLKITWNATCFL